MTLHEAFGAVLKKARKEAGVSQDQLAFDSNLDRTYISLLERGLRQPSLSTIFSLAEGLKYQPYRLVEDTEKFFVATS